MKLSTMNRRNCLSNLNREDAPSVDEGRFDLESILTLAIQDGKGEGYVY